MKKNVLFCLLAALVLSACVKKLTLDHYVIVVPEKATQVETQAAQVLQNYFHQISGANLAIVADSEAPVDKELLIGNTNRAIFDSLAKLGEDGFVIRTVDKKLAIQGGSGKGTLYGAYTLLEEYFGCRKYTIAPAVVPKAEKLVLPGKIYDEQVPAIIERYGYFLPIDQEYLDWHKMEQRLNNTIPDWGLFVHTFDNLLPPEKYFKAHPEYYALVKGERATTQPCLSNPKVLEVVCENLAAQIAKNPLPKYWSVSSNDNFGYCTCTECAAIDAAEESPAGSVIRFVNKVAERFPQKMISTLGYHFTQKAPKTKPAPNVNIMFCSIEVPRSLPISTDTSAQSVTLRKDMEDWGKLTGNILVWDYDATFKVLFSPFPNLRVQQPNFQYFVKNNVNQIFQLGSGHFGGEFAELRNYLTSKLLWNPDIDFDATLDDFLNGYYGAGGPAIRKYIDLTEKRSHESGNPLSIYKYTTDFSDSWLSADAMREYHRIFDAAAAAVALDSVALERVELARQPINFAQMELSRVDPYGPEGFLMDQGGKWVVKPEWLTKLHEFVARIKEQPAQLVSEWHSPPDQFLEQMLRMADVQQTGNLAYRKPVSVDVTSIPKFTPKGQDEKLLSDGVWGTELHTTQWLGYGEPQFDIVVDLQTPQSVQSVNASFLQILWESSFMPEKVEFLTSMDGSNYKLAAQKSHVVNKDPFYGVMDYRADFSPREARYVKVRIHAMDICPSWHYYAGDDALVFVDEVIVR